MFDGCLRERAARDTGLRRAVVSSSANTRDVLVAAGIEGFFEARIDGVVAEREGLKGKPAPDTFLAGARALGVAPGEAAVFEDALAGVAAGRGASPVLSVLTVSGRRKLCASTARALWCPIYPSCWRTDESTPLLPS
jgi:beta-phosphoglucomutase-like phosphatase (HAD superfamily)